MKVIGVAVAMTAANLLVAPCLAVSAAGATAVGGGAGPMPRHHPRHRGMLSSWFLSMLRPDATSTSTTTNGNLMTISINGNSDASTTPLFMSDSLLLDDHTHRSLAFGDYVDPTFSCPAMVTCNIVCVANVTDCPADAQCPGTSPDALNSNHTYEVSSEKVSIVTCTETCVCHCHCYY
jgi:hypothetical protein